MHLLEQRMNQLRRRAARLARGYWSGRLVISLLGASLVALLLDYLIRFEDFGLRLLLSMATAAAVVLTWARPWLHARRQRDWSDLALARRVEGHFVALRDRLASSLVFLQQTPAMAAGDSPVLRQAVIDQTSEEVATLPFEQVLIPGPARTSLGWAAGLTLLLIFLTVVAPEHMQVGFQRLAMPWGDHTWPRTHHLELTSAPERLAMEGTLVVEAIDAAFMPEDAELQLRTAANGAADEQVPLRINGKQGVGRKEKVRHSLWYRVVGGDDHQQPWKWLEVLPIPEIDQLEIRVIPPAYTGWQPRTVERSFRALVGSIVELQGVATQPLEGANLDLGNEQRPIQVEANTPLFTLSAQDANPWKVEESLEYALQLIGPHEMSRDDSPRWEARAVPDSAPTVTIQQPAADLYVTPQASVGLAVLARDDLALESVGLHRAKPESSDLESQPLQVLWQAKSPPQNVPRADEEREASQTLESTWELAPLKLQPGTEFNFGIVAHDFKPQAGTSVLRRLTVISAEQMVERLTARQQAIGEELERLLQGEQEVESRTDNLAIQWKQVKEVSRQDLDQLQSTLLSQRQISRNLSSPTEGIPMAVQQLLTELHDNKVDAADLQRGMEQVRDALNQLTAEHLHPLEEELSNAMKESQAELSAHRPASAAALQSLDQSQRHEEQIVQSLEALVHKLRDAGSTQEFGRALTQLQMQQQAIQQSLAELAQRTLGKDVSELNAQEQADLKKLASQERGQARQLDKTLQQLENVAKQLEASDPQAAGLLAQVGELGRQLSTSATLRASADGIDRNQLSQASQQSTKALHDLEEMLDLLANRRDRELARMIEKLQAAENQLAKLQTRENELQAALDAAAQQEPNQSQLQKLTREQAQAEKQANELSKQLEKLNSFRAAKATQSAAGSMGAGGQSSAAGQAGTAAEQAAKAEQKLQKARDELAKQIREMQAQLADEMLRKMDALLEAMIERQKRAIEDTQSLEHARVEQGTLKREQLSRLSQLVKEQKAIERETRVTAEKLAGRQVFQWALDQAATEMTQAAQGLARKETGVTPQRHQNRAVQQLALALAALADGEKKPQPESAPDGGEGGSSGKQQAAPDKQQVRLLKLLQTEVQLQFAALLQQAQPETELRQELSTRQAELGKMALGLIPAQPDTIPDDDFQPLDLDQPDPATETRP